MPRLDLRGPLWLGVSTIALFFGAGLGSAAYAPIDKGVGVPGTIIIDSKLKPVQHQRGGVVARVHVSEGQDVKTGDLLVSLDTAAVDEQIAALKTQAEAAQKQLALARQEATTMADLLERRLAAKSRVLTLEPTVAEIEKEAAALSAKIAISQQEITNAENPALHSRGASCHWRSPAKVPSCSRAPPSPNWCRRTGRLVIEGRIAPNQIENVKPGMPAKVWLTGLSWREQRPLRARLAWVSPDSVEDKRTGSPYYVARVELSEARADIAKRMTLLPGMRSEVLLLTGERTLLSTSFSTR